ncbi:1-acyl-sn-glycerol-3-phosphate acyltransferase [Candidatus Solirubrobacter pratensis]|uniref:1-acyl-sn-glycerol-3-phosphate acyltransferase n=1 Tax=Candidatus Solirubrobacter pratensis TaxID=1298857 RepID=UPI000423919E|nr:1-acyl-sn-glycerol-3-phosphate acyltransferase [Candidatus Solirubrobacter pratensis]
MDHAHFHKRARSRGVNPIVYWIMRMLLQPFAHLYWRLSRIGREHIPERGAVILASNHRSFLDPFIIGLMSRRPVYYVAKEELFHNRLFGWFISSLGAFPVNRGAADAEMVQTARAILDRGDPLLIFPEGTRIRPGALGKPKRGVGRLVLESGAPVVPIAVIGTEAVRKGWRIRPHKIRVRAGSPLRFPKMEAATGPIAARVTDRIWPNIMLQWEWLGGLPPLRRAAIVGGGSWGTAFAVMLARAGIDADLGCRTAVQAELLAGARTNERYLPGVDLPARVHPVRASELELGRYDLVVFAVPAAELPAAVAEHAPGIAPRTGVLMLAKGLVPPLGSLPSAFVAERTRSWAIGALGGPGHAGGALEAGASLVLATHNAAFARQVIDALAAAGLDVTHTGDVVGVELAGCAKNAAALAAAAAGSAGPNAAGAAAGKVFAEVDAYARRAGSRPGTFAGLAGAGDLVATVLAEGSRNRRAGELLATGVPADEICAALGQTAEAVAAVPLLSERLREAGVAAPVLHGLAGIIAGSVEPERWRASLTAPVVATKANAKASAA